MPDFNGLTEITSFSPTDEIVIIDKSASPIFVSKRIAMSNLSSAGIENISTMYADNLSVSVPTLNVAEKMTGFDFTTGIGNISTGEVTIATTGLYRVTFSALHQDSARNGKVFFRINGSDTQIGLYGYYGKGDAVPKKYMEIFTEAFSLTSGDVVSIAVSIGSTFNIQVDKTTFQLEKY